MNSINILHGHTASYSVCFVQVLCLFNFYERNAYIFVNHEKCLLAELHLYVILAVSEDLFSSCLTNSRQKVEVK